jgi:hypothetical protein
MACEVDILIGRITRIYNLVIVVLHLSINKTLLETIFITLSLHVVWKWPTLFEPSFLKIGQTITHENVPLFCVWQFLLNGMNNPTPKLT